MKQGRAKILRRLVAVKLCHWTSHDGCSSRLPLQVGDPFSEQASTTTPLEVENSTLPQTVGKYPLAELSEPMMKQSLEVYGRKRTATTVSSATANPSSSVYVRLTALIHVKLVLQTRKSWAMTPSLSSATAAIPVAIQSVERVQRTMEWWQPLYSATAADERFPTRAERWWYTD